MKLNGKETETHYEKYFRTRVSVTHIFPYKGTTFDYVPYAEKFKSEKARILKYLMQCQRIQKE